MVFALYLPHLTPQMETEYKSKASKYINREMTSEQTRPGFTTRSRVPVLKPHWRTQKNTKQLLKLISRSRESLLVILYIFPAAYKPINACGMIAFREDFLMLRTGRDFIGRETKSSFCCGCQKANFRLLLSLCFRGYRSESIIQRVLLQSQTW